MINLDLLINSCKEQAKQLLNEYGEYFPFAFGLSESGQIISVSTYFEEFPDSNELISELQKALAISKGENNFKAVAICVDVSIIPPKENKKMDAIEIRLDTREGASHNIYFPYEKQESGVRLFESFSSQGTSYFFRHSEN